MSNTNRVVFVENESNLVVLEFMTSTTGDPSGTPSEPLSPPCLLLRSTTTQCTNVDVHLFVLIPSK